MWASTPTKGPRAFRKPCRGRRLSTPRQHTTAISIDAAGHTGPALQGLWELAVGQYLLIVTCYLFIEKRHPKVSFFLLRFAVDVQLHLADALYA